MVKANFVTAEEMGDALIAEMFNVRFMGFLTALARKRKVDAEGLVRDAATVMGAAGIQQELMYVHVDEDNDPFVKEMLSL